MNRIKLMAAVTGAGASWAAAYLYFSENMNKSSSIVKQTLFTLNSNDEISTKFKSPVKISSRVSGDMNQYKGFADLEFDVIDSEKKKYCVQVKAHRRGLDWKTDQLTVRRSNEVLYSYAT